MSLCQLQCLSGAPLVRGSEEVVASVEALSLIDHTLPEDGARTSAARTVVLVRHRLSQDEAALLIFGDPGCQGQGLVAAVPVCTNVLIVVETISGGGPLLEGPPAAGDAAPADVGSPGCVVLYLAGSEGQQEVFEVDNADPGVCDTARSAQVFQERLKGFQRKAKQMQYRFPSQNSNHDWLWSYGAEKLPLVLQVTQSSEAATMLGSLGFPMVFGHVHLQDFLRHTSWVQAQPILHERQHELLRQVELHVFTVTFNCGGLKPPGKRRGGLGYLFEDESFGEANVVFVALQETCPLVLAVDLSDVSTSRRHRDWEEAVREALAERGQYELFLQERLVGLQLLVFIREDFARRARNVHAGLVRCGRLGAGNKGAVGASCTLFSTSFCFVNVHLASGTEPTSAADRERDFRHIATSLGLAGRQGDPAPPPLPSRNSWGSEPSFDRAASSDPERSAELPMRLAPHPRRERMRDRLPSEAEDPLTGKHDGIVTRNLFEHDVVIFAGDMNMRLWKDKTMSTPLPRDRIFQLLRSPDPEERSRLLQDHDELSLRRRAGFPFAAFEEAKIDFAPTYRMANRSQSVVHHLVVDEDGENITANDRTASSACQMAAVDPDAYCLKREPAYCDRVLWRAKNNVSVAPVSYGRISGVQFSDHRPVRLALKVMARQVRWGELRRLCAGLRQPSEGAASPNSSRDRLTRSTALNDFMRSRSEPRDASQDAPAAPDRPRGANGTCCVQ